MVKSHQVSGYSHPFQPRQGSKRSVRVAGGLSSSLPRPPPGERPSHSSQCSRSCKSRYKQGCVCGAPRCWLSKTSEERSREYWKTCGKGWKAGSVPGRRWALPGLPRGVLSSLLAWLLDSPHARRHSLQVVKTVTSRDCGDSRLWRHCRHRAFWRRRWGEFVPATCRPLGLSPPGSYSPRLLP